METISVFLADWQVLFREGIHFTLSGEEDLNVIGESTGNEEEDVYRLTALIMASLERNIRRHPEQWFIFRRMWNTLAEATARTERPMPSKA